MFTGGGRDWAERELKAGRLCGGGAARGPARPRRPHLPVPPDAASHGIDPVGHRQAAGRPRAPDFAAPAATCWHRPSGAARRHPVPTGGPAGRWPPAGVDVEARCGAAGPAAAASRLRALRPLARWQPHVRAAAVGGFSPADYGRQLVENSDFRKFDDGLMMTIDCPPRPPSRSRRGSLRRKRAGLCVRPAPAGRALMTCIVPSATPARPRPLRRWGGRAAMPWRRRR